MIEATCESCGCEYQAEPVRSHRLLCGDSTESADVQRSVGCLQVEIVLADPPYNVDFDYGDATDDDKTSAQYLIWNRAWFGLAKPLAASCVVLTCGITNLPMWVADIERTHRIIAWVKENQNSRNYIGKTSGFNVWEPVLVYGKAKKCVARDSFSIPIGIQAAAEDHPCPKALPAWTRLVEDFSEPGDVIYDPFLGAGTTLVASEQTGRVCVGLEIEPRFVDVCVRRWEAVTGKTAVLAKS